MKSIIFASLLLGSVAFAHDDHFPEGTLLALEGQDAITKEECFLFVTDVSDSRAPDQYYAKVLTSYSHDHDAPQAIQVRVYPNRADLLVGTGPNGQDQIAIFLSSADLNLQNATSFNLKWLHGNHFHNNRCVNLKPHQD